MSSVRTDTDALRSAARRLRDEAAARLTDANVHTRRTEEQHALGLVFDRYGSLPAYRAVSRAWRGELSNLGAALRQLADALETSADEYDRADADASARLGRAR
jgi:uncharacterized protein YukE